MALGLGGSDFRGFLIPILFCKVLNAVAIRGCRKLNFVFLNEYFEPLKGGFGAKKHGQPRVRKNDRFFELGINRPDTFCPQATTDRVPT